MAGKKRGRKPAAEPADRGGDDEDDDCCASATANDGSSVTDISSDQSPSNGSDDIDSGAEAI
jgi:hypothetical protein